MHSIAGGPYRFHHIGSMVFGFALSGTANNEDQTART